MMQIRNTEGDVIPACFTFTYRTLEISCSTIANPPEVVIFGQTPRGREAYHRAASVPDAIEWVDLFFKAGCPR